jgi:hypothetical protein
MLTMNAQFEQHIAMCDECRERLKDALRRSA